MTVFSATASPAGRGAILVGLLLAGGCARAAVEASAVPASQQDPATAARPSSWPSPRSPSDVGAGAGLEAPHRQRRREVDAARALRDADPPDRPAALGHYLAALAVPRSSVVSDPANPLHFVDETLRHQAAFEAASLLRSAGPVDALLVEHLLTEGGPRGLLELARSLPRNPRRLHFTLRAAAGSTVPEEERPYVAEACIEAAQSLASHRFGAPRIHAARWLLRRARDAGATELPDLSELPFVVREAFGSRSVEGLDFVPSDDCSAFAEEVFGSPHLGRCIQLTRGGRSAMDYVLAGTPARWAFHQETFAPYLVPTADPRAAEGPRTLALVAFRRDGEDQLTLELRSRPTPLALPGHDECEPLPAPPQFDADPVPDAPYTKLARQGEWLDAERTLLRLAPTASVAYSGGGGTFAAAWLLRQEGERLLERGCFHTEAQLDLAGEWHPDGTRDHQQLDATWRIEASAGTGANPTLRFRLEEQSIPIRRATWNATTGRYELHSVRTSR